MKETALTGRQAQQRQKELEREARISREHWAAVLRSESGRYVLLELVSWCSLFRTLPTEPHLLQRSAGVQTVGHHIIETIEEIDLAAFGEMIAAGCKREFEKRLQRDKEKNDRQRKRKREQPPAETNEDPDDESE